MLWIVSEENLEIAIVEMLVGPYAGICLHKIAVNHERRFTPVFHTDDHD